MSSTFISYGDIAVQNVQDEREGFLKEKADRIGQMGSMRNDTVKISQDLNVILLQTIALTQ